MAIAFIAIAFFLAMNIGGSNSAAEMSAAYGAGVRTKRQAVALIAIFALLGALLLGSPVIHTLGKGLVPERLFAERLPNVFVVLLVTTLFITVANISRAPIATTHAIVCSIVGVGLFYQQLYVEKFATILIWWVATPTVSFIVNYLVNRYGYLRILHLLQYLGSEERIRAVLGLTITASGCYVAFSAGANNAANSFGVLVGAGFIPPLGGAVLAGLGMSAGALCFGGRILETVGKEITEIGIVRAIILETVGATLIFVASIFGVPVSLNETITAGIIALSCAQSGFRSTARNQHVVRIAFFWFVAPFLAVALAYSSAALCRGWLIG